MSTVRIAILVATIVGLTGLVACNDEKGKNEQQTRASKAVVGQQTAAQKPAEKPDADEGEEGEEGPATPAAVAAEKPAPQQTSGKKFVYNFDSDTPGQLPAKFHSAKTGGGSQEKWVVSADPTAPSKPNVVTQASTDQTDYCFLLLISDEGAFQNLDLSMKFKAVSGNIDRAGGLVFRLKDPNNYYIVRANALENNYRLYHVVNGRRSQFRWSQLEGHLGRMARTGAEKLTEEGMDTPPSMGAGTAINFQPTGNGRAAIAGDFAMTGKEVGAVMKVLQDNSVQAVALHSHALDDVPRLFYMHFWANNDAVKLAKTLRSALDETNSAK